MIHFVDASSIIDAWKNYPQRKHRDLWACIERRILARNFQVIDVIDVEIGKIPECHAWLHAKGVKVISTEGIIKAEAEEIAAELGIKGNPAEDGRWNDILLVVAAKVLGGIVVTEEKRQNEDKRRQGKDYKIPEICRRAGVPCTSLDELMRRSRKFRHIVS